MDNRELQEKIKTVKSRIEQFIEDGHITEAKALLEKYNDKMPGDPDICSMQAVILIMEGDLDAAELVLHEGLKKDSVQFDLLYNLAYIRELQGLNQEAAELYCKAGTAALSDEQKQNVQSALKRLKDSDINILSVNKPKIVFFVREGMDSFLGDIISGLSHEFWIRKIIVNDLRQIDNGMEWADVCWFEWCDELIVYGSQLPLAKFKKIICRLHRYEVFTDYPGKVLWENVDKLVIVTSHLSRLLEINFPGMLKRVETIVIDNGVNVEKYNFKKRSNGFNLAMVGYIHSRKNPVLLLQIIKKLSQIDKRYKLFVAGQFQEELTQLYWQYQINRMGLESNIIFEGWQNDINNWLEDKNYLVSTSIHESFGYGIAEAMTRGIKPIIHDFLYANEVWDEEFLFNTVDEAVDLIRNGKYESEKYRAYIVDNYSLEKQMNKIKSLVNELLSVRTVFNRVKDILDGYEKPEELGLDDVTALIPCYNRARMLKEDLDKGFKLGKQPKVIVDDCSTAEKEWLLLVDKELSLSGSSLIRKDINSGVAESRRIGLEAIKTKYTTFIDDDNMMVCVNRTKAAEAVSQLKDGFSIVVPRYIINYCKDKLALGYDRTIYDGMNGKQVLKELASSGEMMGILTGGAIGETKWMHEHSSCPLFKVSEDFVMLARMMASKPDMKVKITEDLVFVRRFLDEGSTLNPTPLKHMLGLFSQAVACYYCLCLGITAKHEVLEWMKDRAALIQRLYQFGESFMTELTAYLTGEISEEVFISFLALYGLKINNGLAELAPELPEMRALFCRKSEKTDAISELKEMPLVSIIILTYNRRDMLKRAIDQVLKQDYPNFEVIVMDNCSDDGTDEMVRSCYKDEKRLIYNRNSKNLGPVKNLDLGFYEIAKGKYSIVLFDDDYLIDSSYISEGVRLLETNNEIIFVFGGMYYNNLIEKKAYRVIADQPSVIDGTDFFLNIKSEKYPIVPHVETVLFRRGIAVEKRLVGEETNAVAGDLALILRLSLLGSVGFINKIVMVYNLHNGSMSKNVGDRITSEDDDGNNKFLISTVDDIKELTYISQTAIESKNIDRSVIDGWLKNRIFSYLYWRFNETVKTANECIALLDYVKSEFGYCYEWFRDFVAKKYGDSVLDKNV